ncbi:MAG: type II secretion system F family protein [Thermodesulfobacteriota bacterium]
MLDPAYAPWISAGLAVLAVLLGFSALAGLARSRREAGTVAARAASLAGTGRERESSLVGFLESLGRRALPGDAEELTASRRALVQAGLRSPRAVFLFWGARCLLALGPAATAFLAGAASGKAGVAALMGASLLGLAGFHLPRVWLGRRTAARRTAFAHGLADALDLLTVCVEAGMGLDQALQRVARELEAGCPVVAEELKLLNLELRAGKARADALRAMADRVGLEDLHNLVTLLIQADAFGTSVAQTLRVYSDALRVKRFQRAEEAAAKLPAKLMVPLILFIFPALFVVIGGPAVISLMRVVAGLK